MNNAVFNYNIYLVHISLKVFDEKDNILTVIDREYRVLIKSDIKIKTFSQLDDMVQHCIMDDIKIMNSLEGRMATRFEAIYKGCYPEIKVSS